MYDVIIIGAGTAGLNAALYSIRSGLKTIVLEKEGNNGGQIALSSTVENWLGEKSLSGAALSDKFTEHVKSLGVEIRNFAEVTSVELSKKIKKVESSAGTFESKALIIATGSREKKLGIKGEEEFKGKGISYCALCDAPFFKGKNVAVVGGGNTALEEADYLSKFASKVYLIHRRKEFRAEKIVLEKAKANKKIEFLLNKTVEEIEGKNKIEAIKIKDNLNNKISELAVNGVFVFVGSIPNTELFLGLKKDEDGYLFADGYMRTNIEGVFVAGEVRKQPINQLITAASDGAIAAVSASKFLSKTTQ